MSGVSVSLGAGLVSPVLAGGLTTQALALFAAMTVQPSHARKALIDQTVIQPLINAGIWEKLNCLHVPAAHTSQAGRLNWITPGTYDLTAVNLDDTDFTVDRGYTGDGASGYLDSGFLPNTHGAGLFTQNDCAAFAFSLKQGQDVASAVGIVGGGGTRNVHVYPRFTDDQAYARVNSAAYGTNMGSVTDGRGLVVGARDGAASVRLYKGSTQIASSTQASGSLDNQAMGYFRNGSDYFSGTVAAGGWGAFLTTVEAAVINTALDAFMTALGWTG